MSSATRDVMHGGAAARERVLSAFRALEDHTRPGTPAWLERARRAAIERFAATGFPTTRDEDWRYTNVAAIEATPFQLAPDGVPGVADDVVSALSTDLPSWRRLVFVNGRHVPGRSGIRPISGGGRLLSLTEAIPNDTLSFGPEFPEELRGQIEDALVAFAETDAWVDSIGNEDFYGWSGIEPAADAEYDVIRLMVEEAGITLEDL